MSVRWPVDAERPRGDGETRRRAWLWCVVAAMLALVYLVAWTFYSMSHLSSFARYRQLSPGSSAEVLHSRFRLTELVRTDELATTGAGRPTPAKADAVWVVAEVEVTRVSDDPGFACSVSLLGPDHRVWEPTPPPVLRATPSFCARSSAAIGRPFRFEAVFEVPARDADRIAGVVLTGASGAEPLPVLTPPD